MINTDYKDAINNQTLSRGELRGSGSHGYGCGIIHFRPSSHSFKLGFCSFRQPDCAFHLRRLFGRSWKQQFPFAAEKLGFPSPPPYLSLSQNDDRLLKGVNFASGGAGILNDTGLYFIQRLSFDDQINYFVTAKQTMKAKIGEKAANKLCNEATYLIGIGSNDYVNNFLQPFLADGQQYTHDDFVQLLISTLEQQLLRLHQLGARKVIFHGLGPLGCIPSQRVKSKNGQCLKRVNEWVQEFNSKVQKLITSFNKRLPMARMVFADGYPAVMDLINNPTAYGFKISNTSCCNVDTQVGGLCLPNSKLCRNRKDYVFWDAFHPSDAANEVLTEKLIAGLFAQAPSPK